jgi:enoyl-[acyl-carrier protein] reductase I
MPGDKQAKGNGTGGTEKHMTAGLMKGKRGLVMGVANDHSIAWGIARCLAAAGAELAFTYQPPSMDKRVKPLAASVGSDFVLPCDVGLEPDDADPASVGSLFTAIEKRWGGLDFVVHAIAFSDKSELKGRYADTTRANFKKTMLISCFSFTEVAKRAAALMPNGGALVTLTYGGSMRVMPNYNVMGVAKAALEASVRYLAYDFGEQNVRVNAISAGPVRTLAGSGVSDARIMFNYQKKNSPLRRTVTLDEIGNTALYLLSDLSSAVTGEIHFVDSGYNIVSMPRLSGLKTLDDPNEANGNGHARDEAAGREAAE